MRSLFARHPATASLMSLWVVVYLLMVWQSTILPALPPPLVWPVTTRLFGDLRALDLAQGQFWRTLTANFIHYNFLHLTINLVGLLQLGRMVEEWYGGARTFLVLLLIGLGGNLASVVAKLLLLPRLPAGFDVVRAILGRSIDTPSAGGSVIVCGLVGLIAVVGWRSSTRFGQFVKGQMLAILGFTVLLGIAMPWIDPKGQVMLDNLGHVGGAAAGALIGLAHRGLLARSEGRRSQVAASVAIVLLLGVAIVAQAGAHRRELAAIVKQGEQIKTMAVAEFLRAQGRHRLELLVTLEALGQSYQVVANGHAQRLAPLDRAFARWAQRMGEHPPLLSWPPPWPPAPEDQRRLTFLVKRLTEPAVTIQGPLDAPLRLGPAKETYLSLRARAFRAAYVRPTHLSVNLFAEEWRELMGQLAREIEDIEKQLATQAARPALPDAS